MEWQPKLKEATIAELESFCEMWLRRKNKELPAKHIESAIVSICKEISDDYDKITTKPHEP